MNAPTREQDILGLMRTLFGLSAVVSAVSLLLRFDGLALLVPAAEPALMLSPYLLFAHGPLLLMVAASEARMTHGGTGPEWMRIQDAWLKRALTVAFTYLSLVSIQELGIEIGEIDPSAPEEWPQPQRLLWFLGFSFGMGFVNYMAVVDTLLPVLRFLVRPFRKLSLPVATIGAGLLGAGVSFGLAHVFSLPVVQDGFNTLSELLDSPQAIIGLIVVPLLISRAFASRSSRSD
ncbi:MAG: hypothetical protein AAF645_19720 [Myxococcota bacterium]